MGASFDLGAADAQEPLVGESPDVGPLRFNGGLTQTRALLAGSPAIDQVRCSLSYSVANLDQRGVSRPDGQQELLCDIGAYEFVDSHQ